MFATAPFPGLDGRHDVDLVRDVMAASESGELPAGTGPTLVYVTAAGDHVGTQRWLRARIADYLKRLILRDAGVLQWRGRPVTEALVAFRRLSGALQLGAGAYLGTRFVAEFTSDIYEATREFIA